MKHYALYEALVAHWPPKPADKISIFKRALKQLRQHGVSCCILSLIQNQSEGGK